MRYQQLDPSDNQAVNSRLLIRLQKKYGSRRCCAGELVELTVDDVWQIADAGDLSIFSNLFETRNAFCGTWYLPHINIHNKRTVAIIMARCIAQARNGRISTSSLKSDVTIVFLDPDFLSDVKISEIRVHLRQKINVQNLSVYNTAV